MAFLGLALSLHVRLSVGTFLCASLIASSASAQAISSINSDADQASESEGLQKLGQTAEAALGEVGQRLKRKDIAPNGEPLARIPNRIESRVENRLSNRIDRQADVSGGTLTFQVADTRVQNRAPER